MNDEQYNAQRLRRRMWITIIAALLALITVVLSTMSGAFDFHKGSNTIGDLTGMTEEEAIAAVEKLGGHASVSYEPSQKREGTVIRQSIPAGDTVTPNSNVSLVVSREKEEQTAAPSTQQRLPNFTGLSLALAQATAEELGVHIVEDGYVHDDNIPYGSVVSQSPEGGTEIVAGSAVRVTLSAGPEIVQYTITVSAGEGGSVSPGTTTVEAGKDITFTITPDTGYVVDSLVVDGEQVQSLDSYAFLSVDTNHTLSVTFAEKRGNPFDNPFEDIGDFFDDFFGGRP